MPATISIPSLREAVANAATPLSNEDDDYRIATTLGAAFLGRSRLGAATLLIPLEQAGGSVGRSGGGFALSSASRVAFVHGGRRWEQAAAILECTDGNLADTFFVLVTDFSRRIISSSENLTWAKILAWVEEWQTLLGRRLALSAEEQLGLWGELWVMSRAKDANQLFASWRGPEREPMDFFHDGVGLEVKVSRRALVHHVSQTQAHAPRGQYASHFLSIWVGVEPIRGTSLAEMVESLLNRLSDPGAFLRQLALVGYSPQDRDEYTTRFVPLEDPRWFRAEDIPRVLSMDDGISNLRYVVTLDVDTCLDRAQAVRLWRHFCGVESSADNER